MVSVGVADYLCRKVQLRCRWETLQYTLSRSCGTMVIEVSREARGCLTHAHIAAGNLRQHTDITCSNQPACCSTHYMPPFCSSTRSRCARHQHASRHPYWSGQCKAHWPLSRHMRGSICTGLTVAAQPQIHVHDTSPSDAYINPAGAQMHTPAQPAQADTLPSLELQQQRLCVLCKL